MRPSDPPKATPCLPIASADPEFVSVTNLLRPETIDMDLTRPSSSRETLIFEPLAVVALYSDATCETRTGSAIS